MRVLSWANLHRRARPLLVIVCVIFLWGAAANTGVGFTEFVLGLPFARYLSVLLRDSRRRIKLVFSGVVLVPLVLVCVFPAATNPLHYPVIGRQVTVPAGWGSIRYLSESTRYLEPPERIQDRSADTRREYRVFDQTTAMRIIAVRTQHPDFGRVYYAVLRDHTGQKHAIQEKDLLEAIKAGRLQSSDLAGTTQLHRPALQWLGDLMYWPLAPPILAISVFSWLRQ